MVLVSHFERKFDNLDTSHYAAQLETGLRNLFIYLSWSKKTLFFNMDSEFSDLSEAELGWDSEESFSEGHGTEEEDSIEEYIFDDNMKYFESSDEELLDETSELSEDDELYNAYADALKRTKTSSCTRDPTTKWREKMRVLCLRPGKVRRKRNLTQMTNGTKT